MAIYAIADLHLSFSQNKPMDIFGDNWKGHEEKIKQNWIQKVKDNDLVLLPGDFSWSMYLKDSLKDFQFLHSLPGKKLLLKGNHDYWWTTITKMRNFLEENNLKNIDFICNNSYEYNGYIISGTRGWVFSENEEDKKLIKREAIRLELSIQDGINKYGKQKPIIVCMHYPPIIKTANKNINIEFMNIMEKYNVQTCIYGHLHGLAIKDAIEGVINGIKLKLVSADSLNFDLYKLEI